MAADYVPRKDTGLLVWAQAFLAYAAEHAAELGVTSEDVAAVAGLRDAFGGRVASNEAAQKAARGERQAKDGARREFEAGVRALARRIQAAPGVTDAQRAGLGITPTDRTPTESPRPATRPVAVVDTSARFRHTIRYVDEATQRKARPRGTIGCEIWAKVDTSPPVDPSELRFLAMQTTSPYVAEFRGEDVGKKAYYMLRWVAARGPKGPWSETVEATVTG
jgi:hypothetical protein